MDCVVIFTKIEKMKLKESFLVGMRGKEILCAQVNFEELRRYLHRNVSTNLDGFGLRDTFYSGSILLGVIVIGHYSNP